VGSRALISVKNMAAMKHIDADVVDLDDWGNVEESVQFLIESKSKGIRVDFKMRYEAAVEASSSHSSSRSRPIPDE
jgi:hypothetical protein